MPLDPAYVTLIGSVLGAVTFFSAGYIWRNRPRIADAGTVNSHFAVSGQALRFAPSTRSASSRLDEPRTTKAIRPDLPIAEMLRQVARATGGLSSMVLDASGLPLSRGPESTLVGARLASLLRAERSQDPNARTDQLLKVVESGPVRIQRIEIHGLPDAWLVCLNARRFAVQKELDLVSSALANALGTSLAEDPFV